MGKRKGRCVRKNIVDKEALEPEHLVKAPHSFVIHRGECSKELMDITKDFRKVMEPFTASQLKERRNNTIKDFLSISGYLHVSHMCIFSETELGSYLKLARLPRGPTLTFKLHNYTLSRDVVSSLKKQYVIVKAFQNAPLIVLNSFSGEGMHMKLMANMFQNMFPTINITTVQLRNVRRCVLMNYNPTTKMIDFRHYVIRATPVGLNKGTKKVVQGKIPNLSKCKDISEFFDKAALLSESEFEDDPNSHIVLPQNLANRGASRQSKSAIRLVELGPRMTLQLMKVEDGLLDGEVLFHELVQKTEEEKELIKKKRDEKSKLKEKRKKTQEENLKRKESEKEHLKQKSLDGIKKKKEQTESQRLMELAAAESQNFADHDEDDDADYYRQQVGEEPEADLFDKKEPRGQKRTHSDTKQNSEPKKLKIDKKILNRFGKKKPDRDNKREKDDRETRPKHKKPTVGGRFNKDRKGENNTRNTDTRKIGGRGGNPKYGWKAKQNEEQNEGKDRSFGNKGGAGGSGKGAPKHGKGAPKHGKGAPKQGKGKGKVLGSKVKKSFKGKKGKGGKGRK